jgi:large subunit ribosomal protein L24
MSSKKDCYREVFSLKPVEKKSAQANNYRNCSIKKADLVQVITGKEKGKKGKVLSFNRKTGRVTVEGLQMQTHFRKESNLELKESGIHVSNVMLIDPTNGSITRCKKNENRERISVKTSTKI